MTFFEALAAQTEMGWTPQQAREAFTRAVHAAQPPARAELPQNITPIAPMLVQVRKDPKGRAQFKAFLASRRAA